MTRYVEAVMPDELETVDRKMLQRLLDRLPATPEMQSLEERSQTPPPPRRPTRPLKSFQRSATMASRAAARVERDAANPPNPLAGCYCDETEEVVDDYRTKRPIAVVVHRTWFRRGSTRAMAFQRGDGPITYVDETATPPAESIQSHGWAFFRNRQAAP